MRNMTIVAAAAAVTCICAGQANAATFIQYEARGTGFVTTQDSTGFSTKSGDFFFRFVIETDAGYVEGTSTSDGSTYSVGSGTNHSYIARVNGRALTINGQYNIAGGFGDYYNATINFPSYQTFKFNDIQASTIAAGLVSFDRSTSRGGMSYSGAITSLVQVGKVAGYIDPSVSLLPEPATWAMMILGMGAIGFAMRRRNKNVTTTVAYAA